MRKKKRRIKGKKRVGVISSREGPALPPSYSLWPVFLSRRRCMAHPSHRLIHKVKLVGKKD